MPELRNNTAQAMLEGGEGDETVWWCSPKKVITLQLRTTTEKGRHFFGAKNGVTPSVAAQGDTDIVTLLAKTLIGDR